MIEETDDRESGSNCRTVTVDDDVVVVVLVVWRW